MTDQIRSLTKIEVERLVEWAAAEGWNPGINDAACFWKLDPDGFLGIEVDGRMVGGGAIIRHHETFGFMGLFIVDPQFRGRQLGSELWYARRDRLRSRLNPGATIGLDGVDTMLPFYERGGFRAFTRHRRFELPPSVTTQALNPAVVDLNTVDFAMVTELDQQCFPGDRRDFLANWIQQPGAVSLGLTDGQRLSGFGVMRRCLTGWKIGPLFAADSAVADDLFAAFRQQAGNEPIFLDVPDNNPDALRLCRKQAMDEVFGCTRMYLGPVPELVHHQIYGVTTLEVG